MAERAVSVMSPDEFLAWEREQRDEKHDYVHGEIFAMSGGSARHSFLGARIIGLVGQALRSGPCQMHTADLRLGLGSDLFVYADAVIVCPPIELRPGSKDVITNPTIVFEVLSKSTEAYDRGDKLARYLALASVRQVVFVSQRAARVEAYTRQPDGTIRFDIHETGSVDLQAVHAQLSLDELYAGAFDVPGEV